MLTPEEKKILADMDNTPYGVVLKKFLNIKLENLKDVTLAKSWEETLGKQQAVLVLKDLFSFMEVKDSTPPARTKYD